MDSIGNALGFLLEGEVKDLTGVLNSNAAFAVKMMEDTKRIDSDGDWGYYAKQLAGTSGQWLKVWARWNAKDAIYDYYLDTDSGVIFDHPVPYVGTVY